MAKKERQKKSKSKKQMLWIAGVVLLIILIAVVSGKIPFSSTGEEKGKSFSITEKETRPVLDPSLFTGMTRAAYAAAKEYPDAMNEVVCYCYCDEPPFNHKTLLSCFTDEHGAG